MVAHRDTLETRKRRIRPRFDGKEAEIGRPSANVHHKDMRFLIRSSKGIESRRIIFQPGIKGSLRLFEKDGRVGESRFPRGFKSELLRGGVE